MLSAVDSPSVRTPQTHGERKRERRKQTNDRTDEAYAEWEAVRTPKKKQEREGLANSAEGKPVVSQEGKKEEVFLPAEADLQPLLIFASVHAHDPHTDRKADGCKDLSSCRPTGHVKREAQSYVRLDTDTYLEREIWSGLDSDACTRVETPGPQMKRHPEVSPEDAEEDSSQKPPTHKPRNSALYVQLAT